MIAEPHAESKATSATMPNLMSNPVPTLCRPQAEPRAKNPICGHSGQSGSGRTIRFKAKNLFRMKIKMPLDKAEKIKYNLFRKSINLP